MHLFKVCILILLVAGCSSAAPVSVTNPPQAGDDGWPVSDIATAGFDVEAMTAVDAKLAAGEYPNLHMVVVEQGGALVYEKYLSGEDQNWGVDLGFRRFDRDSLHDLRSVSKSVTALLLGIALKGDYDQLSRPVADFFPELRSQLSEKTRRITLHQVLTMTAGLEWNEMNIPYSSQDNDEIAMYYHGDPMEFTLTKPIREEPGSAWYYNGGLTMVLAGVIEKLTGKPFLEFAHSALFRPLGIAPSEMEWRGVGIFWKRSLKLPSAASGLRLKARDLAKIGHLMLHDGRWQGRQVIPAGWVQRSFVRHTEQTRAYWSLDGVYGYSYQWWHGNFTGKWGEFTALAGVGYGGQRLFILPDRNLVVTVYAGNYGRYGVPNVSERLLADIVAAAP